MRPLRRNKNPKICLVIHESTTESALRAVAKADPLADLIELRVDYLKNPRLEFLLEAGGKPLVITNRRKEEGGKFIGDEKNRLALLGEAIHLGAPFVDIESRSEPSLLGEMISHKMKTRLILSYHDLKKTPSPEGLRSLLRRMMGNRADIIKIVTFAQTYEDNLSILSLIPYAREKGQKVIAFCMGAKGKMSRIFSPILGAAWTYASLDRKRVAAPGQLTALELREIWERLK